MVTCMSRLVLCIQLYILCTASIYTITDSISLSIYIYTCVCVSFILDYISIATSHIILNNTTLHDIMLYCAMLGHMVYYMISIVYYF